MPELTYKQLQKAVTDLGKSIARGAEAIQGHAKAISDEAIDTARVAEMIGSMRVDNATVGETRELSKIMEGVSEAAIAYASASDTTAKAAQAVHDQNRTSHDGINEAANRSPVGRAIFDVNHAWFAQQ
jgi:hypothetical protein